MRLPRISPTAYRRITLLALATLVFIVISGGAVRLTGSGLGCSDWPTCEQGQLVAPLELHPMIEFVNRTITGLVSLAVILAVLGSLVRRPRRRDLTWWSLGLVAGIVGQIVLGGLTVLADLAPPFVMGHYLLSILLVWNGLVLYDRASGPGTPAVPTVSRRTVWLGRSMVGASLVLLTTGTVVTGTGPHGGDEHAPRFGFAITEVARIHSLTAWAFLVLTLVVLWNAHRDGAPGRVDHRGRILVGLIVAQGAIGYLQYATGIPPLLVGVHLAGSVAVFLAAVWYHLGLFVRTGPEPGLDLTETAGRHRGRATQPA
ncbi:MAG: COX15/CtaA family protein [Acidimicrobiales bacterium]